VVRLGHRRRLVARARRRVDPRARALRRGRDGDRAAVVEAALGGAERDLVAVLQRGLAAHALVVDERPVQAAQIAQDPAIRAQLDDAVLLRDDLVEELDRVVRMAPERIHRAKIDRLLAFRGRQYQPSHR
jgi:hypothetical protein